MPFPSTRRPALGLSASMRMVTSGLHTTTRLRSPKRTIAVLGGGISGLTSAHRLANRLPPSQYEILLLESSNRLGGWIESHRTQLPSAAPSHPDAPSSALIEKGPRSIRPTGPTGMVMLELLSSLNLLERMLKVPKSAPSAQNRYIYFPDKLAKLPSSLPSLASALLRLPFLRAIIPRALLEPRTPSRFARPRSESKAEQKRVRGREMLDDESVDSFVSRRFGQGLAANLVSAVIHGIYAGDSRKLSIRSVMPFLWEAERVHGSVLRSMLLAPKRNSRYNALPASETQRKEKKDKANAVVEQKLGQDLIKSFKDISVYSFPNGLQEIVDAMESQLAATEHVKVRKNASISSVVIGEDGKTIIRTSDGQSLPVDRIISSIPSHKLDEVLPADSLPGLSYNPSANVGVVNLVITPPEGSKSLLPVEGFGYLIPRTTPNNEDGILGVVFDSDSLPTQDLADPFSSADASQLSRRPIKLTVMMGGGAHWSNLDADSLPSDAEMRERAIRAVSKHLSIPRSLLEDESRTKVLPNMQRDCIPQYLVGHPVRMAALHRALARSPELADKLTLVGASYTGVSLNDCVAYATEAADKIVDAELNDGPKTVTGLEGFEYSESQSSEASAESVSEAIGQTPPLTGALQKMTAFTRGWTRPAPAFAHARALHTSARRLDARPDPRLVSSENVAPKKELGKALADSIRASGPMPVSTYMRTCLLDPIQGYYSSANAEGAETREVLGSRGDFITSPEISQVFGELVAIFYIARWQTCGQPQQTRLVELGPGKGTLLADMLRTFATFPAMMNTIKAIHLVETSEGLMKLQLQAITETLAKAGKKLAPADKEVLEDGEIRIEWFPGVEDVPVQPDTWTMVTAHEFFDALPTHIFEKTIHGFREVLVGVKSKKQGQLGITVIRPSDLNKPKPKEEEESDELQFVLSPSPTPWSQLLAASNPRFSSLQPGQRVEISPESWAVARRVGELVSGRPASPPKSFDKPNAEEAASKESARLAPPAVGGASLIIDYGADKAFGNSFRAFKKHEIVDVFHKPGSSDLTVNVDFLHLKSAVASTDADYYGPLTQAEFLSALGMEHRVGALVRGAGDEQRKKAIQSAADRLVDQTGMGMQYKVMAIAASSSGGSEEKDGKLTLVKQPAEPLYPFEL